MQHEKATNGGGGGDRHAKASQNQERGEEKRQNEELDGERDARHTERDLTRRCSLTLPIAKFPGQDKFNYFNEQQEYYFPRGSVPMHFYFENRGKEKM